jgi:hypothetical protein
MRRLILWMLEKAIDWCGSPPVEDLTYRPPDDNRVDSLPE